MMSDLALCILWSFVFWIAYAQNDTATDSPSTTNCADGFRYLHINKTVDSLESCMNGQCITKCCPENQIMLADTSCVDNSRNFSIENYSKAQVHIYANNVKQKIIKTRRKLIDFKFLFRECDYEWDLLEIFPERKNLFYLTEDGQLHVRRVNYADQWFASFPPGEFCVELQVDQDELGRPLSTEPHVVYRVNLSTGDNDSIDRGKLSVYGFLVSCFFLLLVLLVYALLKELRNLAGMILMAYVATLTAAFLTRAVLVLASDNSMLSSSGCTVVGITFLYLILASFTWMNVMSFDIWWSLRGFRKLRKIHRRGIYVKFGWYCLYAWGAPLMHILFVMIEEHMDLTHLPNFVKSHLIVDPDLCFLNDSERQLYLNMPILITSIPNLVLFLMTAYNVWRIKNAVTQHNSKDSKNNKKDQSRFWIYLKLSVVMGFSWIFEVLSSMYPESKFWYITDAYNALIGIFIFAVFVCKRKIFVLLCRRSGRLSISRQANRMSNHQTSMQETAMRERASFLQRGRQRYRFSIQNNYVGGWQRPSESTSTRV